VGRVGICGSGKGKVEGMCEEVQKMLSTATEVFSSEIHGRATRPRGRCGWCGVGVAGGKVKGRP